MIDGLAFQEHCALLALGIDSDGRKHALGLREGKTENAGVAKALFADLIERGLTIARRLFVIDETNARRTALRQTFGDVAVVQRCQDIGTGLL